MLLAPTPLALLHGAHVFSWTRFEIHQSVLIGCVLVTGAYLYSIGPLRCRRGWAERVSAWRPAAFLAGVGVLFLALNGPLHDLSDNFLFSAHMVQHMLLTLAVPPLFLLGTPDWLIRPVLRPSAAYRSARALTQPLIAFAIYNVVFVGWHFPGLYSLALENHDMHIAQHLMFIGAAVLMWWPVVNPVPELARISSPAQLLYIFALGIPMSVVAAFVALSDSVLYPWYQQAPRVFELSALEDQQLGGVIMWVPGMIIFWIAMTIVFFRWYAREARDEAGPLASVLPR